MFSIFDPHAFLTLPLKWLSSVIALFYIQTRFWLASNRRRASTFIGLTEFLGNVKPVFSFLTSPGIIFIPCRIFIFICQNNYWGIFPFFFTSRSHLSFCLRIALPLWLGHIVFSIISQPLFILAHLVPLGTPGVLIPFMVIIEIIRTLIRPLTLAVRLTANIIAGHLLLALLSLQAVSSSFFTLALILPLLILLWLLEGAVAVIQAYVFRTLSSLYLAEVNTLNLNKKFLNLK